MIKFPNANNIPGISQFFGNGNYIFSSNNKTHIFRIGDYTLPIQPLVEIRFGRNWVTTEVAGSAGNEKLKGTTIKEDMGRNDAVISFSGLYMSTSKTMIQTLGLSSNEAAGLSWHDVFKKIVSLFNENSALPIYDWIPGEEGMELPPDYFEIYAENPEDRRVKDIGFSMFETLGITHAVLLSHNFNEVSGRTQLPYTIRLQEDRLVNLESIMPFEEVETQAGGETAV